jgi:hypothetical protein
MDEDILLTLDDRRREYGRAIAAYNALSQPKPNYYDFIQEWLCRAQLRKVWNIIQRSGHYSLPVSVVAAIKAAAEEVRE